MMRLFAVLMLLLTSSPAFAAMARPPELDGKIAASAPYGEGELHKLMFHVYDSSLWTDAKDFSADSTYALVIRYNMNFSVKELVDRSITEMERAGKLSDDEKETYASELTSRFHAVKPGDRITALFVKGKGGYFFYNGKMQGSVMASAHAKRFLDIWLGSHTSEPALRKQLLRL